MKDVGLEYLNEIYKASEKAHPLLPDTFEELVELSKKYPEFTFEDDTVNGVTVGICLYYLDRGKEEKLERKLRRKYKSVWQSVAFLSLKYAPITRRDVFEKWKERLKDCEDLDCIVEKIREYCKPREG